MDIGDGAGGSGGAKLNRPVVGMTVVGGGSLALEASPGERVVVLGDDDVGGGGLPRFGEEQEGRSGKRRLVGDRAAVVVVWRSGPKRLGLGFREFVG